MDGAHSFSQRLSQNKRHALQCFRFRHGIFHQGMGKSGMAFLRRLIQALRNRRNQSQFVGDPQMNLSQFQRLPFGFDNRSAHLKENARISHGERTFRPRIHSRNGKAKHNEKARPSRSWRSLL